MNTKQHNRQASYLATLAALESIPGIDRIPGLPTELAIFRAKMGEILDLAQTQKEVVAGKRIRRDELVDEMADAAVEVAALVAAYADKQKLSELAQLVRVRPGDFARTRQVARPVMAKSILDAAQAVLPELEAYGVTAEMLGNLQARITAALEGLHQPRTGIVERKSTTARLVALFDEVDALLENQIDMLLYGVRKTHPLAYANYRSARAIIDRPATRRGPGEEPAVPAVTPVAGSTPPIQLAA